MDAIRYIHAADIHLDAAFRGISRESSAKNLGEQLRAATFTALERLVILCEKEKPDFLVIAGDIYNADDQSLKAQLRLRDACERLAHSNIPVFLAHGNHDPISSRLQMLTWPKNTIIFGDTVQNYTLKRNNKILAIIHGISHATTREARNLAKGFVRLTHKNTQDTPLFQLGILHCTLDAAQHTDRYAPCTVDDLKATNLDAWALGHVHEKSIVCHNPFIAYSGNTQGLHINESGAKGCLLVTAQAHQHGFQTTATFHTLSPVVWETVYVSAENIEHIDILEQKIIAAMEQATTDADPLCTVLIIRVRLTGRTALDGLLRKSEDCTALTERLREVSWGRPALWLKDILIETAPLLHMEELLQREDILGETLRLAKENTNDIESLQTLTDTALAPLFAHAKAKKILAPMTEQDLRILLEDAQYLCADLMEND